MNEWNTMKDSECNYYEQEMCTMHIASFVSMYRCMRAYIADNLHIIIINGNNTIL